MVTQRIGHNKGHIFLFIRKWIGAVLGIGIFLSVYGIEETHAMRCFLPFSGFSAISTVIGLGRRMPSIPELLFPEGRLSLPRSSSPFLPEGFLLPHRTHSTRGTAILPLEPPLSFEGRITIYSAPFLRAIWQAPFISSLRDGSLPLPGFRQFLSEDLSFVESQEPIRRLANELYGFSSDSFPAYRSSLQGVAREFNAEPSRDSLPPLLQSYNEHLVSTLNYASPQAYLSACYACIHVYLYLSQTLAVQQSSPHPYATWVALHSNESYTQRARQKLDRLNRLYAFSPHPLRLSMLKAFRHALIHDLTYFFFLPLESPPRSPKDPTQPN